MMASHKNVIGSNSGGKIRNDEQRAPTSSKKKERIEMLQKWADSKGGNKRKENEAAREEFVEDQLRKRKERFKNLMKKK